MKIQIINHSLVKLLLNHNLIGDFYCGTTASYPEMPFFYKVGFSGNLYADITDGYLPTHYISHGFKTSLEEAIEQAVYEFLERYPFYLYKKEKLLKATIRELKQNNKIPDLNLFAGFNEEQKEKFPQRRYDDNSTLFWQEVRRWSTQERVYLPAQFIYHNYILDENEPYLRERNLNGAGGHWTKEGAILSGLYELIQRDSFLVHWLNSYSPKQIDPSTIPDIKFQQLFLETINRGFKIYVLDTTTDAQIPSFVTILHNPSNNGPCYVLGGGCDLNPLKGIYRSFEEAWSIYSWIKPLVPYPELEENYIPFFATHINQEYRLRLWANHKMKDKLQFFLKGEKFDFWKLYPDELKIFNSKKEELDYVVKKIESLGKGYEVYYYLTQTKLTKDKIYYSAKVIVPKLIPMYFIESNIPLNSSRIKNQSNPLPHLFP